VAHAAGLCHSGTKGGGLCDLDFMGRAMAGAAFWRGGVAFADFLTVNAAGVLGGNLLMATRADGFGDSFQVGVLFVLYVARTAGQRGVCPLFHLLPDIVAGGTGGTTRDLRPAARPCSPQKERDAGSERGANPRSRWPDHSLTSISGQSFRFGPDRNNPRKHHTIAFGDHCQDICPVIDSVCYCFSVRIKATTAEAWSSERLVMGFILPAPFLMTSFRSSSDFA